MLTPDDRALLELNIRYFRGSDLAKAIASALATIDELQGKVPDTKIAEGTPDVPPSMPF